MGHMVFQTAFAEYTVDSKLGEGGSGQVFKVTDERGQAYALKLLHPGRSKSQKMHRFQNEAWFCFRTVHPNIVRVLDYGLDFDGNPTPFYVMPYYASNLRKRIQQGIPPDKVLPYFAQLLDGVATAHHQGVWHRDLKPENILHDPQEDLLVVADFGIAHFAEELQQTEVQTGSSERLANFQYAAPEQRRAGEQVDQRADIYALGLILNEMFTGQVIQGQGFRQIASVASAFGHLDALVDRMVQQLPDRRLRSVDAVWSGLGNQWRGKRGMQRRRGPYPEADHFDLLLLASEQDAKIAWPLASELFLGGMRPVVEPASLAPVGFWEHLPVVWLVGADWEPWESPAMLRDISLILGDRPLYLVLLPEARASTLSQQLSAKLTVNLGRRDIQTSEARPLIDALRDALTIMR